MFDYLLPIGNFFLLTIYVIIAVMVTGVIRDRFGDGPAVVVGAVFFLGGLWVLRLEMQIAKDRDDQGPYEWERRQRDKRGSKE